MTQPQIEYQLYLQELEESSQIILYDVDERPCYIKQVDIEDPLCFTDWMEKEMEKAIEQEDYEYAIQLRDEYKQDNLNY